MASDRSLEERKKRTLDALGRRFAQEEAEHLLQQQKTKKKVREEKDKIPPAISYPSVDASVSVASPSNLSAKKGSISFSSNKSAEEASEPAYFELSNSVQENLLRDGSEISNQRAIVDHLLHDLFKHGDSADKYMQGSRSKKIDNWILLDNFVQKNGLSAAARLRALQPHSRRSKRHMSLKQHKKHGSFHLPQQFHNFELFKPMHEMWKSYISQLLKHVGKNQLAQCLLNADLHGSVVLGESKLVSKYLRTSVACRLSCCMSIDYWCLNSCSMQNKRLPWSKWYHDSRNCRNIWNNYRRKQISSCAQEAFYFHAPS